MRLYMVFGVATLLLVGCGAQNSPKKKEDSSLSTNRGDSVPSTAPSTLPSQEAFSPPPLSPTSSGAREAGLLPDYVAIEFPSTLTQLSKREFQRDIEELNRTKALAEFNFEMIKRIFPKIKKSCEEKNPCLLPYGHYTLFQDSKTITLDEIRFSKFYSNDSDGYDFELTLKKPILPSLKSSILNDKLTWRWQDRDNNLFTLYEKSKSKTTFHYFIDYMHREKILISYEEADKKSNYFIRQGGDYKLYMNYLENLKKSFSSNIHLERDSDTVLAENENIFELNIDTKSLEDGEYLLIDANVDTHQFSEDEIFERVEGMLTLFNHNAQAFLFSDKFVGQEDKLKLLRVKESREKFEFIEKELHLL